jgi:hypothetical protein
MASSPALAQASSLSRPGAPIAKQRAAGLDRETAGQHGDMRQLGRGCRIVDFSGFAHFVATV